MVKYRCAKDCSGGRRLCDKVYCMFRAPTDDKLFDQWRDAVAFKGTIFKKSHCVCEEHFQESDIRKDIVLKDVAGNVRAFQQMGTLLKNGEKETQTQSCLTIIEWPWPCRTTCTSYTMSQLRYIPKGRIKCSQSD